MSTRSGNGELARFTQSGAELGRKLPSCRVSTVDVDLAGIVDCLDQERDFVGLPIAGTRTRQRYHSRLFSLPGLAFQASGTVTVFHPRPSIRLRGDAKTGSDNATIALQTNLERREGIVEPRCREGRDRIQSAVGTCGKLMKQEPPQVASLSHWERKQIARRNRSKRYGSSLAAYQSSCPPVGLARARSTARCWNRLAGAEFDRLRECLSACVRHHTRGRRCVRRLERVLLAAAAAVGV